MDAMSHIQDYTGSPEDAHRAIMNRGCRMMTSRRVLIALGLLLVSFAVWAQKPKRVQLTPAKLWLSIKAELTGPDGENYFNNTVKGALLPGGVDGVRYLTGTLLSAEPTAEPSVLVLAISDRSTPEVTVRFKDSAWKDTHITGPLKLGSLITFEGVPVTFTKEPFMVTFGVSTTRRPQFRNGLPQER
jgi:hypothetical protein